MELNQIIKKGFILIRDKKIAEIGAMQELNFTDDETINLYGQSVYPGFIDAHAHLGIFEDSLGFEGCDGNEYTEPLTPHLRGLDAVNPMDKGFQEALLAGITTVITGPGSANPIGGQLLAMKTMGTCIDDMVIREPLAIKFALGENPKVTYNEKSQTPITRMATAAIIREQLSKAQKYLLAKEKALNNPNDFEEPEYDAKCEALLTLLKKEIPAHIHVHRADDIFTAIRIAKEFDLEYVLIHATEGHLIAEKLRTENVKVLSGPILSDRSKPELVNLSTTTPGILSQSGIDVALITDHPETPTSYLCLCAAIAIRDGMSPADALKAITINAAKICGIDNRVGSIAPGKDADLVVFNDSPFNVMQKPSLVICDGMLVKK